MGFSHIIYKYACMHVCTGHGVKEIFFDWSLPPRGPVDSSDLSAVVAGVLPGPYL